MTDAKTIGIVTRLQQACADAFKAVTASLHAGVSERDIAGALRSNLAGQGITDHWYNVPFVVLIGPERFRDGTTTTDYAVKAPSAKVLLSEGQVIYADFAPMDTASGIWGDWSSNCVFKPHDIEQLEFLKEMRNLYQQGITLINAKTTGAEVAQYYQGEFARRGVTLLDVRNNVGHSMHSGLKSDAKRIWLDFDNTQPLGPGIFAIEPGGISNDGKLVARYEECILIPKTGPASIIGSFHKAPLAVSESQS